MHKTSNYTFRLWRTRNLRGIQNYTSTHPTKLYWVLFPIDDLKNAVETARRLLTKER